MVGRTSTENRPGCPVSPSGYDGRVHRGSSWTSDESLRGHRARSRCGWACGGSRRKRRRDCAPSPGCPQECRASVCAASCWACSWRLSWSCSLSAPLHHRTERQSPPAGVGRGAGVPFPPLRIQTAFPRQWACRRAGHSDRTCRCRGNRPR